MGSSARWNPDQELRRKLAEGSVDVSWERFIAYRFLYRPSEDSGPIPSIDENPDERDPPLRRRRRAQVLLRVPLSG